ncbi:MAG: zinc ribbon domain-containing protein [Terriglobia bacterium]
MFCANCGAKLAEGQNFCSSCGRTAGSVPLPPPPLSAARGRVERHLRVLGVLWIVWAVVRLFPGIGLLFYGRFVLPVLPFEFRDILLPFAAIAGAYFLAYAAACFLTGWGLMQRRPWARILAIVLAILSLVHLPLGTALGIYTLWVIVPAESEVEYRRISGPA